MITVGNKPVISYWEIEGKEELMELESISKGNDIRDMAFNDDYLFNLTEETLDVWELKNKTLIR